jgi:BMFP domain-containing protein YqiC
MDDIVKDFLIESRENLDRLEQELAKLAADLHRIASNKSTLRAKAGGEPSREVWES